MNREAQLIGAERVTSASSHPLPNSVPRDWRPLLSLPPLFQHPAPDLSVNIFEVNVISSNWGATGATAVPEPASWLMILSAAAICLLLRIRRANQGC